MSSKRNCFCSCAHRRALISGVGGSELLEALGGDQSLGQIGRIGDSGVVWAVLSTLPGVIVEKTDRLYRNFRDYVTLEDLEVKIHLPKEGQIISKESKSRTKLMHGIHVVMARNYIENLREEVKKGMREKAEQGIYPSRPPLGYQNNKLERTIELDSEKAPLAKAMFEKYGSGQISFSSLRAELKTEFGVNLAKSYLDRLLKNPFYVGQFYWQGKLYLGTHTPLPP